MSGRVAFGSSQERKLFPLHVAPNRLGLQMLHETSPHLGPACHYNNKIGTLSYDLEKKPVNKRGYVLSRTADRFPPIKTVTSSPLWYQPDQSKSRIPPTGKTPFSSTAERFKSTPCVSDDAPGPGTYAQDAVTNRKVSWPMCFGRPDWSRLPPIDKRLQVKLIDEKDLIKQRNRLAYLSLYY